VARVAVIDDDPSLQRLVTHWLERDGHDVTSYSSGTQALGGQVHLGFDVVLLDIQLGDMDGLDVLDRLMEGAPHAAVVMMTANGDVPAIVDAMRRGAYDYLVKPVTRTKLTTTVRNGAERTKLAAAERHLDRVQSGEDYHGMLGTSPAMAALYERCDRVAPTDVTVLIQGESGTGKELVAQALHARSRRAAGPFVPINCAAVTATLQESELFGHLRGAFTGAHKDRAGRFEQAHGGTLFLDEVAELSAELQAKLLRVLQERTLYRVGGNEEIHVDVRVIAASHRDLGDLVASGQFREDLYYRLAVFELQTPPLRDRGRDILLLAERFLASFCAGMGRPVPGWGPDTAARLMAHPWPGNVRELRNAMETAAVTADDVVRVHDLPPRLRRDTPSPTLAEPPTPLQPSALPEGDGLSPMERMERDAIQGALTAANGNVSEVIRALQIPRTSLYRKLRKYGLK
jgi:DNA-binding NtrC family response regulator